VACGDDWQPVARATNKTMVDNVIRENMLAFIPST
jgi:hypothetical protein